MCPCWTSTQQPHQFPVRDLAVTPHHPRSFHDQHQSAASHGRLFRRRRNAISLLRGFQDDFLRPPDGDARGCTVIDTGAPQTGAESPPSRPSRRWYWVAGCLAAAAVTCITLAVAGVVSWDRQVQHFQRVPVPGRAEITFTQPGGYVLYVETRGSCCSWAINSHTGPFASWGMDIGLAPAGGGPPVPVRSWHGPTVSYAVTGHQGRTAGSFTIIHPGTYVVETKNVTPPAITDLAASRGILRAPVLPAFLFLGLVALLAAGIAFGITAFRRRRARRGLAQAPGFAGGTPGPAPGAAPGASVPVLVGFAGPAQQNRGTVLVRAILAIPHFICLYFARYAAWIVLVAGWFGALFTGRLPDSAAEFLTGYQRWEVRVYSYMALLTDKYPPFGWRDTGYPVTVTVRPGRLNRMAVLFRFILIIPAGLVWTALSYGLGLIMMAITWLIVLILGRMPQPLYEAIAAITRYWARIKAYWYLLTDVYPDGLFGDQPEASPALQAVPPPALLPADYVPLPASASAAPAAASPAPSGGPGRLVLSRPAKRLVGLTLALGAGIPVAMLAAFVALAASMAPSYRAAAPAAAAPSPPRSSAPAPLTGTHSWLKGLKEVSTHMYNAMGPNNAVVSATWLRSAARQLGACSAELAALGPPPAQLRQVHRQAAHACGAFEQGARCYAAAARAFNPNAASPSAKLNRLLNCGDARVNRGSNLISLAIANGSFLQPPG